MEARHEKKKHPGRHRLDCACADYGDRFTGSTQTIQNLVMNFSGVQTAAVATFASNLTQTVVAHPTATPTLTPTTTPTLTLIDINATEASATPTPSCYHLRWIKDVTVKDFTPMNARRDIHKNMAGIKQRDLRLEAGFSIRFLWRRPDGRINYTLTQLGQSRR